MGSPSVTRNPIERNFLTRFLVGLAVVFGMFLGGGALGWTFLSVGVPYGDWIGTGVGAVLAFAAFAVLYRRYDASFDAR